MWRYRCMTARVRASKPRRARVAGLRTSCHAHCRTAPPCCLSRVMRSAECLHEMMHSRRRLAHLRAPSIRVAPLLAGAPVSPRVGPLVDRCGAQTACRARNDGGRRQPATLFTVLIRPTSSTQSSRAQGQCAGTCPRGPVVDQHRDIEPASQVVGQVQGPRLLRVAPRLPPERTANAPKFVRFVLCARGAPLRGGEAAWVPPQPPNGPYG